MVLKFLFQFLAGPQSTKYQYNFLIHRTEQIDYSNRYRAARLRIALVKARCIIDNRRKSKRHLPYYSVSVEEKNQTELNIESKNRIENLLSKLNLIVYQNGS